MIEKGFTPSPADPCLWTKEELIVAVFVDDILAASLNQADLDQLVDTFGDRFKLTDLGEPSQFLGIQFGRDQGRGILALSQSHYLKTLLKRFKVENIGTRKIPLDPHLRLKAYDGTATESDKATYASAVGSIGWGCIATRPDFACAYRTLARYVANPGPEHFKAPLWTTDSNFAGDLDTGRSTGGFVIFKGQACIGWQSKLQSYVTLPTTEAKYIALSTTARELIWFRKLEAVHGKPTTIHTECKLFGDNQACFEVCPE